MYQEKNIPLQGMDTFCKNVEKIFTLSLADIFSNELQFNSIFINSPARIPGLW